MDPRTKKPHPLSRIEDCFPLTKYNVDVWEPTEKQAQVVAKKMIELQLPLSKTEVEATVKVKHSLYGQSVGTIKKYCAIKKENYDNEGCTMDVKIVPGDYDVFLKEMNSITKGEFQFDVVGAPSITTKEEVSKKGGGKKKK